MTEDYSIKRAVNLLARAMYPNHEGFILSFSPEAAASLMETWEMRAYVKSGTYDLPGDHFHLPSGLPKNLYGYRTEVRSE
jgi:hypothetical protein